MLLGAWLESRVASREGCEGQAPHQPLAKVKPSGLCAWCEARGAGQTLQGARGLCQPLARARSTYRESAECEVRGA